VLTWIFPRLGISKFLKTPRSSARNLRPHSGHLRDHAATQNAIYRDNIRIQELTAFFRHPDLTYESTGHPAQKIRVTGYLLWDDDHIS